VAGSPTPSRSRIDRVIVSHTDDDHIQGLIELFDELQQDVDTKIAPPYRIDELWLNVFDLDAVGVTHPAALTTAVASADEPGGRRGRRAGRPVGGGHRQPPGGPRPVPGRDDAPHPEERRLRLGARDGDADRSGRRRARRRPHPHGHRAGEDRIDDLRKQWQAFLERQATKDAKPEEVAAAAVAVDRSVYNLSSIVVLAERKGRSMLLTGDGLGGDILDDLDRPAGSRTGPSTSTC
jgi:hypothetical protein